MTDIYIVLEIDRHTDEEIRLFLSEDVAVASAKAFAEKISLEEHDIQDWIYFASGVEGDSVRVEKKTILLPNSRQGNDKPDD